MAWRSCGAGSRHWPRGRRCASWHLRLSEAPSGVRLAISWPGGIWLSNSGDMGASPMSLLVASAARTSSVSSSVPQPSPAGHPRAAEHLARPHLPGHAPAQNEHDAATGGPARTSRSPTLLLRGLLAQQRPRRRPHPAARQLSHEGDSTPRANRFCWALLQAGPRRRSRRVAAALRHPRSGESARTETRSPLSDSTGPRPGRARPRGRGRSCGQRRSKRSSSMTFVQAAAKSAANFARLSSWA